MPRTTRAARIPSGRGTEFRKNGALLMMLLPGLVVLLINSYLPMAGIVMAFERINYNRFAFFGDWVGLRNLKLFLTSTYTPVIVRNTLLYNLAFIVIGRIAALAFSIMLSEMIGKTAKKIYQGILFLPYFISWIAISYIVYGFLNYDYGLFNRFLLPALGIAPVQWYRTPQAWPFIIIFLNVWKGLGYGTVMFLASIAGIDPSLYEAARVDGATRWQQIWSITIPLLLPMLIVLTLLSIGSIFNTDIGLFYSVPMRIANGALTDVTSTLDTYVYTTFSSGSNAAAINLSSAAAFLQSVIGFVLVICSNLVVRRINPDYRSFRIAMAV